jgi:bacterioferritin-associated ferredoxin
VFVCLCNALTDRDIHSAAEQCCKVSEVYRCHGVTPDCGKCVPFIRDALRAARSRVSIAAMPEACEPPSPVMEPIPV